MDAAQGPRNAVGLRVVIDGGRTPTELDALAWARRAEALGAGEIVLNSIDADGTRDGYELAAHPPHLRGPSAFRWSPPAGRESPSTSLAVFEDGGADAALVASMVHYGAWSVGAIKDTSAERHSGPGIT